MLFSTETFDEEFGVYDENAGTLRDYVLEISAKQTFSLSLLRG